jgi:hypothetical protein
MSTPLAFNRATRSSTQINKTICGSISRTEMAKSVHTCRTNVRMAAGLCRLSHGRRRRRPTAADRHRPASRLFRGDERVGDADGQESTANPVNPRSIPICVPAARAMRAVRRMRTFQKFSSIRAEVLDHFNQERHGVPLRFTNKGEPSHWPSDGLSRPNGRSGLGVLRPR